MGVIDWNDPTVALGDSLTTALNTLGDATSSLSAAINNETDEATHMDLALHLASYDLSSQTNPSVTIHILESVDGGTTYSEGTDAASADTTRSALAPAVIFPLRLGTASEVKDVVITGIPITASYFKLYLTNQSGAAFASSGNTLKYRTYKKTVA